MPSKTSKGKTGERLASEFLKEKGFKIIAKNYHSAFGEIDIIALKNKTLYFCEVKTRWSLGFGSPEESVNERKIMRIKKTIDYYIYNNKLSNPKMKIIIISQLISDRKLCYQKLIEFS